MTGSPGATNAATDISAAPIPQSHNATQASGLPRDEPLMLHSRPAIAANQISTDRSTCTTRATRKKSATGNQSFTTGVRDSTSSTENTPEPINAISPSHN